MTKRVPVRIVTLPFLLPLWAAAQVIMPRTVFVAKGADLSVRLLAHELVHVTQWEKYGLAFAIKYLVSIKEHGYHDSAYEVEARQQETNAFYLAWARDLLAQAS